MTRLLVSVRSAAEAADALAGGANLIDVKEPSRGSLGAADPAVWRDVAHTVAGRAPVSVALGELTELLDAPCLPAFDFSGIQFAKLGLRGCAAIAGWREAWANILTSFPPHVCRVAVSYADWRRVQAPPPEEVIAAGSECGCSAWLIDTHDKTQGGLLDHARVDQLAAWIKRAHDRGMQVALAGSLTIGALAHIRPLQPDWIAVRGAVCANGREGRLDSTQVHRLATLLRHARTAPLSPQNQPGS